MHGNRSTSHFILVTKHFRAAGDFLCVVAYAWVVQCLIL